MKNLIYILSLFFVLIGFSSIAQTTDTYTATGTWTCPAGVTSVTVTCIGGGGGAGGGGNNSLDPAGAGGGAGGAYASSVLAVTPTTVYTVTVGTGGAGGAAQNHGTVGNPSWFNTTGTIFAEGGARGNRINATTANGGVGATTASIGTT